MEEWRDVKGYEGYYAVSNLGRVKSVERYDNNKHLRPEHVLCFKVNELGYQRVHLSRDGIAGWFLVHRLVAEAFIEKPEGCDIVNHLDNNPSNNKATNLEWTTYKGNMQYASKQGRMKGNPENLKKAQESRKIPVIAIKDGKEFLFESGKEAGRILGIKSGHIAAACRKEYGYKTVGGYEWRYADENLQRVQTPHKVGMTDTELREYLRKRMTGNKIMVGRHLSEEHKEKLRIANSKPILQYTKDGGFVARFSSASEATTRTGIRHITTCARGQRGSAGGYVWKYEGSDNI